MKNDIHPEYRPVVFEDLSNGNRLIVSSTIATKDTVTVDGVTYPLVRVEITSTSHPFYTGKRTIVDSTGRVDRFKKMADRAVAAKETRKAVETKRAAKKTGTDKQPKSKKLSDLAA